MWIVLVSFALGALLGIILEPLRHKLHFNNEVGRKIPHLTHALVVMFWPFFVPYSWLVVFEICWIAITFIIRKLGWYKWLWEVGRKSWGEYSYMVGIIVAALMQPSKWIFAAAMLHLAVADSMAAIIGKRFGHSTQYKVLGQTKSIVGSFAFFLTSAIILAILILIPSSGFHSFGWGLLLWIPLLMTALENVGVYGFDNFFIIVVLTMVLERLQI